MSYQTDRRLTITAVITDIVAEMRVPKLIVYKEIIATVALAALAYQGRAPTIGVAMIGIINTVSVAELYSAWRRVQAKNREEMLENKP